MTPRLLRWAPLVVLFALPLMLFAPGLLGGHLLAPNDGIAQDFPMRVIAAEALRHGEWPFWNPYNFSGSPLLAGIQVGLFFPANWGFWVLPPLAAMNVAVLLGYWLAGFGTFAFARVCGLDRAPALLAAIAYMAGGFMVQNVEHVMILHAAGTLPVLLVALERVCQQRSSPVVVALAVAALVLAGHPQMAAYSLILAGAYTLWRLFGLGPAARLRTGLALLGAVALGLALCAAQLWPTVDFIGLTQRQLISYDKLTRYGLPLFGLPSLLFPLLFGSRVQTPLSPVPFWGQDAWGFWAESYTGSLTLTLAILGVLASRHWPAPRFWTGAALIAGLLILGDATPVFKLWAALPVVNQMPYPHRHNLEFTFACAMLAGWGLQALRHHLAAKTLPIALGLIGATMASQLALLAVWGPGFAARTQAYLPAGIDLASALSLGSPVFWLPLVLWALAAACLWAQARSASSRWLFPLLGLLTLDLTLVAWTNGKWQLGPQVPPIGETRIYHPSAERSLSVTQNPYPYQRPYAALATLHYPGMAALEGIRSINGYDAFIYKRYGALWGMPSLGHLFEPDRLGRTSHLPDITGLAQVRLEPALLASPAWQEAMAAPRWRRQSDQAGLAIFENTQALPATWRVTEAVTLAAGDVDKRLLGGAGFSPARTALLEAPLRTVRFAPGTAAITGRTLNRIQLSTEGQGPGLLMVSESFDPGWKAYLGERELPIHRADALIMAIEVPAGAHSLELRYEPTRWKPGLAVTGLAALLLLVWGLRRRPTQPR